MSGVRCVLFAVALVACAVPKVAPPSPPRRSTIDLQLAHFELTNGLRVVHVHDPRARDVQVTMRYRVGSIHDPDGQEGIAHLVEHLMFQQILGDQTLFAKLEANATSFNATTSPDATVFEARAPRANLEQLLAIEAVRVGFRCTSITDSAFEREREVVINELRQRGGASEIYAALYAGLYPADHPYRRAPGGSEATVSAITRPQACAFADAHYAPSNAVLVVSGALSTDELQQALVKFLAKIPARQVSPPPAAPVLTAAAAGARVEVPLEREALVIAWPLPHATVERVRVRALAETASAYVDSEIKGSAFVLELGDTRVPLLAMVVVPADGEELKAVEDGARRGLEKLPDYFLLDRFLPELSQTRFGAVQQTAVRRLFASYEEGSDRDARLAAHVHAGRDPRRSVDDEILAVRTMTPSLARELAKTYFTLDDATILRLAPRADVDDATAEAARTLRPPVHDIGQRRTEVDPAEASRPLSHAAGAELAGMVTRRRPNGLTVVLLPVTSVPTVDARIVFGSGTADEPPAKRGAALAAGYAMSWDVRHANDILAFVQAGGETSVDVGVHHTSFVARGLDMHADYLLAGLRRWVLEGRYDESAARQIRSLRSASRTIDDDGALTDAWRAALFGADHPYVEAGLARHASDTLEVRDVSAFRTQHFTPANATLVVAGRFDAALVDKWIDYLFSDWEGSTTKPARTAATLAPAALALDADTAQLVMRVAFAATTGTRAQRLIAAEILDQVANDVRHQLGASYGVYARLDEARDASNYLLEGTIDAARITEVVELLRVQLEAVRAEPEVAARMFVRARKRVLAELLDVTGSARGLGERVTRDIELGLPPMSAPATVREVSAVTIDGMAPVLASFDLARATVLLRGPAADLDRGFAALGRTPTRVRAPAVETPADDAAAPDATSPMSAVERLTAEDFTDALTTSGPRSRFLVAVLPGITSGKIRARGMTGYSFATQLGLRLTRTAVIGVRGSITQLDGTYNALGFVPIPVPVEGRAISAGVVIHGNATDRGWISLHASLSFTRFVDDAMPALSGTGFALGLEAGYDIVQIGGHGLGVFGRADTELASDGELSSISGGLSYRY